MLEIGDRAFMDILERAVGSDNAAVAAAAFNESASVSVRLNPSKVSDSFVTEHFSSGAVPVPWCGHGFMLDARPSFTLDPLFHAGCYYVQDSSAMYVGSVFRNVLDRFKGIGRPVRVLDLCAAPGGKTTDLAASLRQEFGNDFILVANEVMRNRAAILSENVALWGDSNVAVTSSDPKAFSEMAGYFDIILADVPCSGEGMFRKDVKAREDWSEDAVNLCAARQRRIVGDVWKTLRTGGMLVYSTCTFEEAENDSNVRWIAGELGAEIVETEIHEGIFRTGTGALLVPGFVKGEGQFVSALEKTASADTWKYRSGRGTAVGWLPENIRKEAEALAWLHPLRLGLPLGLRKGSDFVPAADLALSIDEELPGNIPGFECGRVEVDRQTALKFLHRDNIFIENMPKGYLLVCYEGHPLGFVKNLGNRWNSLFPQGRRIRMNVE